MSNESNKDETQWKILEDICEARNLLDADLITQHLSQNVIYETQAAFGCLEGKEAVTEYLHGRFDHFRNLKNDLDVGMLKLGYVGLPWHVSHPCAVHVTETGEKIAIWLLTLDEQSKVCRIDILTHVPAPRSARLR